MRDRLIALAGSLAVATVAVGLTPHSLAAQAAKPAAPKPAAKPAAPPRAADGHPDFTGFYDVATMTPVERPNGAPLVLSDKEAAAMEAYEYARQVKNDAPIAGDRSAPPVGGEQTQPKSYLEFLERAGGGVVGGYNNFWLAGGMKMITVDGQKRSSLVIDPPDGKVPPMKQEARDRNARFLAGAVSPDASESASAGPPGAFDGPELRPLAERCLLGFGNTSGPPTLPNYFYNNMKQIVQTKDTIMILNEMVHDARIIRMNAEHLPQNIRRWMGDSVGRWEGDTLVVDTTNFTSKTQFRGSSENLHVVERFSWMDGNLRYRFTVDDPSTWDRAWTGEYPWVASTEGLYEYACHEGNYALGDMLRGARAKEAEDAAKKP
ncbi:MAG: hypothetical protein LAO77_08010 [Acidobacteriia bacterium]|nr:hypothetical protein [Terriglobia bacterium]